MKIITHLITESSHSYHDYNRKTMLTLNIFHILIVTWKIYVIFFLSFYLINRLFINLFYSFIFYTAIKGGGDQVVIKSKS